MSETLAKINALPAWLRYAGFAALGIFILAFAELLEEGDVSRLTSDSASSAMLKWCVPILLAGLGGLYSERAGVVNIGLEGMMILGTWFGAWGTLEFGSPWAGLAIGMAGGALGGLVHAVATVSFGVDHIISGVAINITAPGITKFLSTEVFGSPTQSPNADSLPSFTVPGLTDALDWVDKKDIFFVSDVSGFIEGLFSGLSLFTVIAMALVPVTFFTVWKTRFGLRLRIAGENPLAGESLGVDIIKHKYIGVVVSGALSGLAGAFISMELSGFYQEGQTQGRGYIGLAALIFGNWRPGGVLAAALLFGYPFGTSLRDLDGKSTHALLLVIAIALVAVTFWALSHNKKGDATAAAFLAGGVFLWYILSSTAPDWLPNTLPFAMVLLVLFFASQRLRMPAADGLVYRKGGT